MLKSALQQATARLKLHLLIALLVALAYVLYVAAWHNWRGHISNIPGFLFIGASLPWSWTWIGVMFDEPFRSWPNRWLITYAFVAAGAGFNCGLLSFVFWFMRALLRPNNSFKPRPLRGSA